MCIIYRHLKIPNPCFIRSLLGQFVLYGSSGGRYSIPMRIWGVFLGITISATIALAQSSASPLPSNAWSELTTPSTGRPESIGFYSLGCLRGARELRNDGIGYQSMFVIRNRHFAHPDLISLVEDLARKTDALGSGLLIGDTAQVRGGPLPYGHASHQVGLDADIWFWTHPEQRIRSLTMEERNTLPMISMLNANGLVDPARFGREQILKLKLASLDPRVERIFVNPAIKTYLCSALPSAELNWLHKLRPWPGHDAHFHVRIHCPFDSKLCTPQDPVANGDGCDEILRPKGMLDLPFESEKHRVKKRATPLPTECLKILEE